MAKTPGRGKDLTEQERVFCRAYVRLGYARLAAKEADYSHPEQMGYRLLRRPLVRTEVDRLRAVVNASRDPVLVADANEVREKLTWLMRHADSEDVQLKSAVSLARLIGMTGEFGLRAPADVLPEGATPAIDTAEYAAKGRAELVAEGKVIALRLLGSGDGSR